jgi:hypothetical protein
MRLSNSRALIGPEFQLLSNKRFSTEIGIVDVVLLLRITSLE